jgi:hypothetical protein
VKERDALLNVLINAGIGADTSVRLVDEFAAAIRKEMASRPPEWQRGTPGHPENGMGM